MFMVTTTKGVRVHAGNGKASQQEAGLTEAEADASATARNVRAETLGVKARYVVVPFVALDKPPKS
jgi:hypothetical protein